MDKLTELHAGELAAALSHDVSADFILPEYMPPIRRVVSVEARALPESRFMTGAALDVGGTLALCILYIGEDGALTCADETTEYSASCALGDAQIADAARVGVDTSVESVNCRVTAPRAFTIRARMRTSLSSLAAHPLEERITDSTGARLSSDDQASLERLMSRAADTRIMRGEMTGTAAGTCILPAGVKPIRARGAVKVDSAHAADGAVQVRGEVLLHVLALTSDGQFARFASKSPIAESVAVADAAAGDYARAWGRSASVSLTPTEGESTWEIEYDLEVEAARAGEAKYTADAYSVACAAELDTAETESLTLLRCGVSALTISGDGGRQRGPQPGEVIADVMASAAADHVEARDGQLILHGMCAVSVLVAADGDAWCEEFALPFRCEMPSAAASSEDILWRSAIEVVGVNARPEGDKLSVTADLCVSTTAMSRAKIRRVTAIRLDRTAPHSRRDGVIRICYPDAGEPMWEIGKRFAVRRESLGDAEFSDGTAMIV